MTIKLPLRRHRHLPYDEQGFLMPALVSVMIAASIISTAVLTIIMNNFFVVGNNVKSQQAFNIAEAGINYYLWHLSHNATDYKDGQSTPATPDAALGYGPYVHSYVDDNGKTTGSYTLWVKPKGSGSTIVDVRAIGKVNGTDITRTVQAQIGAESFANYATLGDTALWFGNTESAAGPVHSNQGIRMDGSSDSDVTSANATYIPPGSLGGDGSSHNGVWCSTTVTTPVNCNTRDKTDWRFPTAAIDFNQVSSSLCTMKKTAFASDSATSSLAGQANACTQVPTTRTAAYLPQRGTFNIARGYLVELNTNGTYNLYNVNGETDTLTPYTSALTLSSVATNIALPSSGVIFAEDNVWVRTNPTFHGRVTIGAGRLATSNNANIVIADDMLYSAKDGSDAIGLIAEDSVLLASYAPPASGNFTFEVDAATLAQTGSVIYPDEYRTSANRCTRGWVGANQKFVFYGSVASRQTWTWTWQWGGGSCGDAVSDGSKYISGIKNNTTSYDYNLQYAPPPSYPITGGYQILSWREVLTHP
jgi:hypothetical protein